MLASAYTNADYRQIGRFLHPLPSMKRTSVPQPDVATLFIAASEQDSNLYYATKFMAPDPFIYLEIKGERLLVMSDLEMDRAKAQATVDRVLSYSEVEEKAKSRG